MASITKHGERWRAFVVRHGMRQSRVFDTQREAKAWAAKTEAKFAEIRKRGYTFAHALEKYESDELPKKKAQKWIHAALGRLAQQIDPETPLEAITQPTIAAWRDRRLRSVSGSTVVRESNLLRAILRLARIEWHWMDHDAFAGVRMPDENDPRHQVWRWQLIKRVLRAQRTGKTAEVQLAFHIALRTGMRLSEVLKAPDVFDAKRRVVVLPTSKTTGRVEVPIGRIAAKLLASVRFTVGANEASVLFGNLCRELLIEGLTFHDSRGSALTWLSRKVDVMTLAKISRHRDLSILQNVYYRESAESIAARL